MIWLLAHPTTPHPSAVSKLYLTHEKTEKDRHISGWKEGGGGAGKGAESYDRKKAWSSVKHSILSASGGRSLLPISQTSVGHYRFLCYFYYPLVIIAFLCYYYNPSYDKLDLETPLLSSV
jgi:hypothetical protein